MESAGGNRGGEGAMRLPLVYVVVLNWNRKDDTIECVGSLLEMDYPNFRIVVVDNGSDDGSVEALKARFPALEVLVNSENLGYAAGNNVGIRFALQQGAEYVLILNNDTVVDQYLLTRLIEVGETNPQAGMLAPKIYLYGDKHRIASAGSKKRWFPPGRISIIGLGREDSMVYDREQEVEYASGCAMLVNRKVFEEVGMFDPTYFVYWEDYDFCKRVRKHGYKIIYVPTARMWHKVSTSTQGDSWVKWYHIAKSTVHFYRKNVKAWHLALPIYSVWVIMRELVLGNWGAIRPYIAGILDSLRGERFPCA
ncbi:MAG: glycosyltransferase family 2 protein [Halobacteria archaeon]